LPPQRVANRDESFGGESYGQPYAQKGAGRSDKNENLTETVFDEEFEDIVEATRDYQDYYQEAKVRDL